MSFLNLSGKVIVVMGVANKRSVAYRIARLLEEEGAKVVYSVHSAEVRDALTHARPQRREGQGMPLLANREVHVCDVERDDQIVALADTVRANHPRIHGLVHSIAFANYNPVASAPRGERDVASAPHARPERSEGRGTTNPHSAPHNPQSAIPTPQSPIPFHAVRREDFLQCVSISCYSLIAAANAFKDLFDPRASVVTISISTTRMAVESYGYMAPAKAALESSLAFLAKSFSRFSEVRFNAVGAGLLKTSASAGIPGYIDHYMYAEHVTLRKRALTTDEVAGAAAFLLSERSSGINAQRLVVDAGMETNYFDADVVKHTLAGIWPAGKTEAPGNGAT